MTLMTPGEGCRLGVLAFGDSITNGGGERQWGVALQPWAQWLARALGLAITNYAADGAFARDVVSQQIPALERRSAHPAAHYELGCLYIGVNDVREPGFSADRFGRDFALALRFLIERCDRVVTITIPLDLGRPRARAKALEANDVIERVADQLGALVVDLRDFKARNLVMPDHVHPTAFGQIVIAERALAALERNGLPVQVQPRSLIDFETTWSRRLHADVTYAYRHAKVSAKAVLTRVRSSTS